MEKKNTERFCIQFNSADPKHLQVIQLLEAQGRRKAQYIAEAVLHYSTCVNSTENNPHNNITAILPAIKAVFIEFIKNGKFVLNKQDENTIPAEVVDLTEPTEIIDEELLALMRDSLTSLREEGA